MPEYLTPASEMALIASSGDRTEIGDEIVMIDEMLRDAARKRERFVIVQRQMSSITYNALISAGYYVTIEGTRDNPKYVIKY